MNNEKKTIRINRRQFIKTASALSAAFAFPTALFGKNKPQSNKAFHFAVTSDCHMYGSHSTVFQDITCKEIMKNPDGPGAFMIVNGDLDPFVRVKKAVQEEIILPLKKQGKEYHFYPAVGNHDLYNTTAVKELCTEIPSKTQTKALIEHNKKNLKNIINPGPEFKSKLPGYENNGSQYTNYSFDYENCHFAIIDLYFANSKPGRGNGNFYKATAEWLENDLNKNKKKNVFVVGHEPAIPYTTPWGKEKNKHMIDYHADKLWEILKKYKVNVYFSGHTHDFGIIKKDGVTQVNTGISGIIPNNTYVLVFVDGDKINYKSYVHRHIPNEGYAWKKYKGNLV